MMHTNKVTRPNGSTDNDIKQAHGMLQMHICEYNQANLFLAEVIKIKVTQEKKNFSVLHKFITDQRRIVRQV